MLRLSLPCVVDDPETYGCALAATIRPGWYLVRLCLEVRVGPWIARLSFTGADGQSQDLLLTRSIVGSRSDSRFGIFYLNAPAARCGLRLFGVAASLERCVVDLRPIGTLLGMFGSWLQNPQEFRAAFQATEGSVRTRVRRAVEVAATRGQAMPKDYTAWHSFFDVWSEPRLRMMEAGLRARPSITALVFAHRHGTPALEATLASLRQQRFPPHAIIVRTGTEVSGALEVATGWVAVLQAGEVVPPHALLLLAVMLDEAEPPALLYADEDRLGGGDARSDPVFRPEPSLTLMCSGLLSRGLWLVRHDLLDMAVDCAETTRLAAWFTLCGAGRQRAARRVPFILTHSRDDTERASPIDLARAVNAGLSALNVKACVDPAFPLRLQWTGDESAQVSIIIPSRLKGEVQLACIRAVIEQTKYNALEILVLVTQQAALDPDQEEAAARLRADRRVRVERVEQSKFNYSATNNIGVERTSGALVLLLNDDVSPLHPDWLRRMVSVLSDPCAGIVGAKLYYPDMTTQHGGVGIGFGGLAQHLHRFLPRGVPGYQWRAVLDQELSCVTGACLLVRRSVFEAVGGLDEALPTAFNDVDFCLKVRRAGWGIVFAASAELVHHETITFGHHYGGDQDHESADVAIMKARWSDALQEDPFYNPNLIANEDEEWQVAFPPGVAKPPL